MKYINNGIQNKPNHELWLTKHFFETFKIGQFLSKFLVKKRYEIEQSVVGCTLFWHVFQLAANLVVKMEMVGTATLIVVIFYTFTPKKIVQLLFSVNILNNSIIALFFLYQKCVLKIDYGI